MVPKYCFRVETIANVGGTLVRRTSNHELLAAAFEARTKALGKPATVAVTVMVVIDETTRLKQAERLANQFNP